jgi:hypothetical protein
MIASVEMFYMNPFMSSEVSTPLSDTQQNQEFNASSDAAGSASEQLSYPSPQQVNERKSDSYTLAFARLTQSFLDNAHVYQNAQNLFKDQFRPLTHNDQDDVLKSIVDDNSGRNETSVKRASNDDMIGIFYKSISYNPFDTYRELATTWASTTLNTYTTHAFSAYWMKMLAPVSQGHAWLLPLAAPTSANPFFANMFSGAQWPFAAQPSVTPSLSNPFAFMAASPLTALWSQGLSLNPFIKDLLVPEPAANPYLRLFKLIFWQL